MPRIYHYEVEQTRTVRVTANNEVDAAIIAQYALDGGEKDPTAEPWGYAAGTVEVIDLSIRKQVI